MLSLKTVLYNYIPFLSYDRDRDTWIKKQLETIAPGEMLLDAGAGECRFKPYAHHLKYVSQDFGEYTGEGDGKGLQTGTWDNSQVDIISDISSIPLEDRTVDNILCSEVLEHIPHPEQAIKEFARLMKPGGALFLTAPFTSLTHYAPYHFCTGFNKYWYQTILTESDFEIKSLEISGNYFSFLCQEILRFPLIAQKYATVKEASLIYLSLFAVTLPLSLLIYLISFLTKGSEELLGTGIWIRATKKSL